MIMFPGSDYSLLIRTDFSDEAAWESLCEGVHARSEEGFRAYFDFISDRAFRDATVEQLVEFAQKSKFQCFICVADATALTSPEHPVLVVDLSDNPGRTFRVIPHEIWGVENNLSIANMDFYEFADECDPDGIFRGFS